MKNSISFQLWGQYALFTDPITKLGGEKFTYPIPTYEAIKGVLKSIYWKPTIIWYVDKIRVIKAIKTESKSIKPLEWNKSTHNLAIYTFLYDVQYQIEAHFEWNMYRKELEQDRIDGKHFSIATRMLEKGGRQDIFLGVRDCQGYVAPCDFGAGEGFYDAIPEIDFGPMFHGFDYPDETGKGEFWGRFWQAVMKNGILEFPRPEHCDKRRFIKKMDAKKFDIGKELLSVHQEEARL